MKLSSIGFDTNFTAKKRYSESRPANKNIYEDGYSMGFTQGYEAEIKDADFIGSKELSKIAESYVDGDASSFKKGYIKGLKTGAEAARKSLNIEA